MTTEKLTKWRLILGRQADPDKSVPLGKQQQGMDDALDLLYNEDRRGGLGKSSPRINRWLRDIRDYFPKETVQLLQRDALDRLGLKQMLLESELMETITPDVHLASIILDLNKTLPERTRDAARAVVRQVVKELEEKLRLPMQQAIRGSLNRAVRNHRPKANEINWQKTILANLRHYQPDYRTVIPERLIGYGKKGQQLRHVILLIDQSGSMSTSVVYAAVLGSILASLRSIRTHLVVFDTNVVDLTDLLHDPVELLFAAQLGGGTHIAKALDYAQSLIQSPKETMLVLISDLYEGVDEGEMVQRIGNLNNTGAQFISLLALNDEGAPSYNKNVAAYLAQLGIPAFACSPTLFPDLMATAIHRGDLRHWLVRNEVAAKN